MKRYCSYCKKQTEHEYRAKHFDYRCTVCGSVSADVQGISWDLM